MTERHLNNFADRDLEKALEITLSPKTPDEVVVNCVTPWKKAMTMALLGIAFTMLTPNLFYLNYILPAIGIPLLFFGFRRLRGDSREFRVCFIISAIKTALCILNLFFNSTIYSSGDYGNTAKNILLSLSLMNTFALIISLIFAIKKTQLRANLPVKIRSLIAMAVLYIILLVWALLGVSIPILGWAVIISYIAILVNIHKILKDIDTAGYCVKPSPVKISDTVAGILLIAVTALGIVSGYLFFHSYDMKWNSVSQSENASVIKTKEKLKKLGLPETVLDDMSDEDIIACKDAVSVYSETAEYSVDESYEVVGFIINPDDRETKEIRFTHILICLDKERNLWMYLEHFEWINGDNFYGTEAIQLWTSHGSRWTDPDSYSGRVLYTENGKTYFSPFFALGSEGYEDETPILGGKKNDVFAKFSFPSGNLRQRGYICYIGNGKSETHTGCWLNYNHQKTFLQYPVTSAAKSRQKDLSTDNGAFIVIDDIYNFDCETDEFM